MPRLQFIERFSRYLLCEKTSTIRIVGHGASGKSSLAKDLADESNSAFR
ncbi:hypothetical protein [Streptococcus pluranimalium]|uniref:Uncharacterized protein n=1 Tax=Streptococcus pluranimalium TaxID=82348 RepID=A0A345VMQ0_9STRE|nr:hypothetical protein [Streptococcus pluranimalium]AXJ14002.1 hypothetical protein Sp14A_21180 [Streptococcus pluranimalium]